ncbi:MAG TPA: UDP-glucose/GDP-mannose dehydrogenase family protein [Pseudobacteroides sp.]|uniref:UDP-glucose dehydrogenase family protein n=1 Tax=Pseudobacteroides sp. TaxID=1968840 RepID=UPI002F9263AB
MKICIIGTGYVGLVTGTCFAELGNEVICVDNNLSKVESLRNGIVPIYEPGLEEMIRRNYSSGRLKFSHVCNWGVKESDIIFIAVGTPSKPDGSADLSYVLEAAESIGQSIDSYKIIVNKSTSPVGTVNLIQKVVNSAIRKRGKDIEFDVVSNPEFLRESSAIDDFMKPNRIVIGAENERAVKMMKELYNHFINDGYPVLVMNPLSSEMTKYAANAMLATKISFINEISNICEKLGADVELVSKGIGTDDRIGEKFLNAGIGYGGSCFPKDVRALINISKDVGYEPRILESVESVNNRQKRKVVEIIDNIYDDTEGLVFAVWGLSFKPGTNDMRESPAINVINALLQRNAIVNVYDPKAIDEARSIFGESINYCKNQYDALNGASALILLTEWSEFKEPDFGVVKNELRDKIIIDGRNQYDRDLLESIGFKYYSVGRKQRYEKNIGNRRSRVYRQPFVPQVASAGK